MKRGGGVAWLLIGLTAGCGKPPAKTTIAATVPAASNTAREYVDLEPGWRLRIVAPVTRSGSYEVKPQASQQRGNTISLKTGDDLIGYETAFWSIQARPGNRGVKVALASAELTINGSPSPIAEPTRAVVHVPPSVRYVRAFYLTRKSAADHNMALAGAARREQIEAFTRAFHHSPEVACSDFVRQRHYCEWIPAQVAVRPEQPKIVDGVTQWPQQ